MLSIIQFSVASAQFIPAWAGWGLAYLVAVAIVLAFNAGASIASEDIPSVGAEVADPVTA